MVVNKQLLPRRSDGRSESQEGKVEFAFERLADTGVVNETTSATIIAYRDPSYSERKNCEQYSDRSIGDEYGRTAALIRQYLGPLEEPNESFGRVSCGLCSL